MSKFILLISFILIPIFLSPQDNKESQEKSVMSKDAHSILTLQSQIDSLEYIITKAKDQALNQEIEFAKQHIERANRIIDWSAMFFTAIAILIVIAGGIGLKQFSNLRQMEKDIEDNLNRTKEELQKIKESKSEILENINRFIEINYFYNEGKQAYQAGRYLNAREMMYKVIDLQPTNVKAYFYIGRSLTQEKNYEEANSIFNEILSIDTNSALAYLGLAILYSDMNDKEQAEKYCRLSIDKDPKYTSALDFIGTLLRDLGKIDEAVKYHFQALRIEKVARTCTLIGLIYYVKDDFINSERYFEEADYLAKQQIIKVNRVHWAHYIQGLIKGLENKMEDSKYHFKKAMEFNQSWPPRRDMINHLKFLLKYVKDKENINMMIRFLENE